MEWHQKILQSGSPAFHTEGATSFSDEQNHLLWCIDKQSQNTLRLKISEQGTFSELETVFPYPFENVKVHKNGYICASYHNNLLRLEGFNEKHEKQWEFHFPRTVYKWNIAVCHTGNIYVFYMTKKDGYSAHIMSINKKGESKFDHIFSFPDIDIVNSNIILSCSDHLAICAKTHRHQTISYCLDRQGNILCRKIFSDHELSERATPICGGKIGEEMFILGGYKENARAKQKTPWICLFDYEMTPVYDAQLPSMTMSQTIREFALQEDGSMLALASPWTIYRFNPKGILTHSWEMPIHLHSVTLTSIKPTKKHGCLLSGNMYAQDEKNRLTPALWCGKIRESDFLSTGTV